MNSTYVLLLTYRMEQYSVFLLHPCLVLSLLGLLAIYLGWDHVILLQASHRECRGREGNILIFQVIAFDMSLF